MDKKFLNYLEESSFELVLTQINQTQKYIDDKQEIMRTIKTAMDGRDNLFSNEFRALLLAQLANHTTELSKGLNMQYGQFYYIADRLADRIANAEQRCKDYDTKFYTYNLSNIAKSYEYKGGNSYLVYEKVNLCKRINVADFTRKAGVGESLYSAAKNAAEELVYNVEIPKTKLGFIFKMVEEMGFAGVMYTSKLTGENVVIIFNPAKCIEVKTHKVIQPAEYQGFFMGNKLI